MSTAGLLHAINWGLPGDEIEVSKHIKICRLKHRRVSHLYEELCKELGVDDGDPFDYECYVLLLPDGDNANVSFGEPDCLLDRICNVVALVLAYPIALCRVVLSTDDFQTCLRTEEIFRYGTQTDFLMCDGYACIDVEKAVEIKAAWQAASALWEEQKTASRVNRALTYFYYAWRSPYLEQCCLNLSVCLKLLFTPHSHGEASDQIPFNVARFLGESQTHTKSIYCVVQNFCSISSQIVQGGMPDEELVIHATLETFRLSCDCLRKILVRGFGTVFDRDADREALLSSFMSGQDYPICQTKIGDEGHHESSYLIEDPANEQAIQSRKLILGSSISYCIRGGQIKANRPLGGSIFES